MFGKFENSIIFAENILLMGKMLCEKIEKKTSFYNKTGSEVIKNVHAQLQLSAKLQLLKKLKY